MTFAVNIQFKEIVRFMFASSFYLTVMTDEAFAGNEKVERQRKPITFNTV